MSRPPSKAQTVKQVLEQLADLSESMEKKWEFGEPTEEAPEGLVSSLKDGPLSTGQEFVKTDTALDWMCLTADGSIAGGIPKGCTIEFIGPAGSGKTRTALSALAVALASGVKCALVLSEERFVEEKGTGRPDLRSRLVDIGQHARGCSAVEVIESLDNLFVFENLGYDGNSWGEFATGYRYLAEKKGIQFSVIDSMTMIDRSNRSAAANMNALKVFNHKHGITCLSIGQVKDGGVAGGEQIQHAADAVFLVDLETVNSKEAAERYGCKYRDQIITMKAIKSATTRILSEKLRVYLDGPAGILEAPKQVEDA